MRFGAFLLATRFPGQSDDDALARTVEAAVAAERAGFDEVWVAEHHFMSYGVCPSAATLAGFLLGATSRVHVGTAVSVLSTQHPVALGEQAAMLAAVSGGRFRLGVGRGGPWRDLEVFGTGLDRYERGFAESLDLLLTWLGSERVGWSGEHFAFREVPVVPRTAHPVPVAVACTSPATEALAADRGLPMLLGMHVGDEDKAGAVARYGRPAPHISTALAQVADAREAAVRLVTEEMPRWLGPGLDGYVPVDDRPRQRRDPYAYARELCDLHPVGTPDDCVDAILTTVERTGIRHVLLMVEAAGSRAATLENIARLGEQVLPRVRAAVADDTASVEPA
ncbi:LLM class flavin-dependent oxidoreductase [Thermomonospora cellulosilytica]|uniref:Alkanesulfonate monooxygenase SsuD/methylene tetrahydromethanopterin reductase-like flavin-dependent oxidoreductase (Luciferase family) n=1 Tax=Thermomonospora cellulosilytica TaxID=1411118 RepID=A0A7W3N535_9ACTN|nr:LLM class flavin-dependent oxidoreductase [Thermomonospora cellulosilytica]MBA9007686.1 alkanesulfonate monooxygenase SsuD/methylene tetrahydromethanopterin reductase-like flavin-dependent oxidoreductase (luciferase family) [Thermomonospora cellulosilytica]